MILVENGNKRKFALWVYPETLKKVENAYESDNCRSQSEFIEKAVIFYLGYLSGDNNADYFAKTIASTLRGIIKSSEDRLARMQFKEAVELAKIVRMIAPLCEIDDDELRRLHIKCVDEVKHINGILKLENVTRGES